MSLLFLSLHSSNHFLSFCPCRNSFLIILSIIFLFHKNVSFYLSILFINIFAQYFVLIG
nr:MAG TPA: hypothetical protein [Caudoviricetes sp.]